MASRKPLSAGVLVLVLAVFVPSRLIGATPASAATVTVAAAGDIANPGSPGTAQTQTAALIGSFNPTAVFALGDEQYEHGELANFQASYNPTWGQYLSKTFPVPGNHEYETPNATGYYGYFGARAGDPSKGYYSFNLGNWHVVAINDNCSFINCTAEKAFIKADLAADTHVCEAFLWHRTAVKWVSKLAVNNHVELGLAGHRHTYERYAATSGFQRFTVGTGGRSLGGFSGTQLVGVRAFGILELALNDTSYSYQFVDVNRSVRDSGSGTCV